MIRQLAIFIENQKGRLRQVTESLHSGNVSIYACSTVDSPEFGILRMIVDEPERAKEILSAQGFVAKTCEIIAVKLEGQKDIDGLLQVIDEGNININYIYSSFGSKDTPFMMILHCTDLDESEEMIRGRGFSCLDRIG